MGEPVSIDRIHAISQSTYGSMGPSVSVPTNDFKIK